VWETKEFYTGSWRLSKGVRDHLEYPGVDNNNIHLQVSGWRLDWINLYQDSDKWPDLVKNVMKLRVAENEGNSLTS
jgi:hypothetical protein